MVLKTFSNGEKKNCETCDILWGVVGIGLGLLFVLIGVDLATNGAISHRFGNVREEIGNVEEFDDGTNDGDD